MSDQNKIRLLIYTEFYPPDINVAGLRIFEFVETFSSCNTEIEVIVHNPLIKNSELNFQKSNVMIKRFGNKYLPSIFHVLKDINPITLLSTTTVLLKETHNFNPDFVIVSIPSRLPAIAALAAFTVFRKKYCIDMRDNWLDPAMDDYFFYRLLPNYAKPLGKLMSLIISRLFLLSVKRASIISAAYEAICDKLKISNCAENIIFLPNGINFSELEQTTHNFNRDQVLNKYNINRDRKTIIYIGGIGGYYRPDLLIDPIIRLTKEGINVNYILLGDGKLINELREKAKLNGIESIYFLGKKQRKEVLELLLSSDVGVYALDVDFPSPDCALGVKVLEYLACGLPLLSLAGKNSIVSSLIKENKLGIAINYDELGKLDAAIKELIHENDMYCKYVDDYYPKFKQQYDRNLNNLKLYGTIEASHRGEFSHEN